MKTVISAVLSQEKTIEKATSSYLDDIYINEDTVLLMRIWVKLAQFGLVCKDPEQLKNGACVLSFEVLDMPNHFFPCVESYPSVDGCYKAQDGIKKQLMPSYMLGKGDPDKSEMETGV